MAPREHVRRWLATGLQWAWGKATFLGAIQAGQPAARRFGAFGEGSFIAFPVTALYNERYIRIGERTRIGPHVSLSVGMALNQVPVSDPVITIGDRCLIGRGSGIVGHLSIEVGDDVFTGHHVYITDQNHGYADPDVPIGRCASARGRGSATEPSCCRGRPSAVTSLLPPDRWSAASYRTTRSRSATRLA